MSTEISLRLAARHGRLQQVIGLLDDYSVNPNAVDDAGYTPLYTAALGGHADIVQCLLGHQADPNLRTVSGKTPLQLANNRGFLRVVQLLS